MSHEPNESYIGDGVYASYDGFGIWLRAPRENGDDKVYLEPLVWQSLVRFADKCEGIDL